jgi:hypothetical protein
MASLSGLSDLPERNFERCPIGQSKLIFPSFSPPEMHTLSSKPFDFFRRTETNVLCFNANTLGYGMILQMSENPKNKKKHRFFTNGTHGTVYFSKKIYLKLKTDEKTMLMFTFIKITNTMI